MRSDFLMALLICGTLIVALPPISDQMHNRDVKDLLSRSETKSVYLEGRMSTEYRASCYVLGAGMIIASVVAARSGLRTNDTPQLARDVGAAPAAHYDEAVLTS